ncbi:hypothetical protein GCM10017668_37050 [Streptomyces tuirus]|uniref:Pycsar effector protein domain-containing protein n=2 Tax=Streptomyces tuirus TaxID=68278 RepID=A0A7G1NHW9_9ACTN|nr:hypothetical protein GCM10017668_37050 [Streptomyces tuirus]
MRLRRNGGSARGQQPLMSQINDEDVSRYAASLLATAREEIVRADGKASLLLATVGIALGAIVSAILSGDWTPFELVNCVEWIWWVGVALAVLGVVLLGCAVHPRVGRGHDAPDYLVAYFGDIAGKPRATLEQRIRETLSAPKEAPLDQLYRVSNLAASKYWYIRTALWALASAMSLCPSSLLLNLAF